MNTRTVVPLDDQYRLRELRQWHWDRSQMLRKLANDGCDPSTTNREADQHIKFVQYLNNFFELNDNVS